VLAFPILGAMVLESLRTGRLELSIAAYAITFRFFGLTGIWQGTI
jgi:hypothetical protein